MVGMVVLAGLLGALLVAIPVDRGVIAPASGVLDRVVSLVSSPLSEKLAKVGIDMSVGDFRARQLLVSAFAGIGVVFGAELAGTAAESVLPAGLFGVAATICGFELWVERAGRTRSERITRQVPNLADLVCLGVIAGESLRSALLRAGEKCGGAIGTEFEQVEGDIAAGVVLSEALGSMARRAGSPAMHRLVAAVAIAQEKGSPLAEQIQNLATELRADERRLLVEAAGKAQTRMLLPVVFLILPTALAFAFFPGVMALRTFVRG